MPFLVPFHGHEEDAESDEFEYKRVFGRRGDEFFEVNRRCLLMMDILEADERFKTSGKYNAYFSKMRNINKKGYKFLSSVEETISSLIQKYQLVNKVREHNRQKALKNLSIKTGKKMKKKNRIEEFEVEEVTENGTKTYIIEREVHVES